MRMTHLQTTHKNVDESHKRNVQWEKPDPKQYLLYESYLQKQANGGSYRKQAWRASGSWQCFVHWSGFRFHECALLVKILQAVWHVCLTWCIFYFNKNILLRKIHRFFFFGYMNENVCCYLTKLIDFTSESKESYNSASKFWLSPEYFGTNV